MNFKVIGLLIMVLRILTGQVQSQNDVYDAPDQVVWHASSKTWFVSNLGGGISLEEDNNGWISRIDQNGQVLDPFWFGKEVGMHAPSGMTITDNYLFVVDRNGVYQINIDNQKIETFTEIPDGEFLNDIVRADNGDLYISDFFGNKIYKIPAHSKKAEVWLKSDRLEAPDGLYMEKGNLVVASWGVLSKPNSFDTSKLGDLLSVDLKTKKITALKKELGNLEGITKAGKYYYITDWTSGKLLKVDPKKGQVIDFVVGLSHPTDPDFSEEIQTIGFPQHGTNQVLFIKL